MPGQLKIGTRGSALALTQSRWVQAQLEERHPDCRVELVIIKTSGDLLPEVPLAPVGASGFLLSI